MPREAEERSNDYINLSLNYQPFAQAEESVPNRFGPWQPCSLVPTASLGSPVSLSLGAQGSCAQHPTLHPLCLCLSRLQQPCLVLGHCCAVTNVLAQLSPFFFFPFSF